MANTANATAKIVAAMAKTVEGHALNDTVQKSLSLSVDLVSARTGETIQVYADQGILQETGATGDADRVVMNFSDGTLSDVYGDAVTMDNIYAIGVWNISQTAATIDGVPFTANTEAILQIGGTETGAEDVSSLWAADGDAIKLPCGADGGAFLICCDAGWALGTGTTGSELMIQNLDDADAAYSVIIVGSVNA